MSEADELMADVRALRRKSRADRHAYWFPLLFFGVAIALSAPLYVETVTFEGPEGPDALYSLDTDPRLPAYWSVVLLAGALLTVWWYRRQGSRSGIESRVEPSLVAAALFLIAYTVLGTIPAAMAVLWPLWFRHYSALLVIAVGLLALARQERSRELWIVTVAYVGAAVIAVLPNGIGGVSLPVFGPPPFLYEQLSALVLPASVLLAGGAVAGVRSWRSR